MDVQVQQPNQKKQIKDKDMDTSLFPDNLNSLGKNAC